MLGKLGKKIGISEAPAQRVFAARGKDRHTGGSESRGEGGGKRRKKRSIKGPSSQRAMGRSVPFRTSRLVNKNRKGQGKRKKKARGDCLIQKVRGMTMKRRGRIGGESVFPKKRGGTTLLRGVELDFSVLEKNRRCESGDETVQKKGHRWQGH